MLGIFSSRKTTLALIVIALHLLTVSIPALAPYSNSIGQILFAIFSVTVLGITVEDSITKWADRPNTTENAIRDIVDELLTSANLDGNASDTKPLISNSTTKTTTLTEKTVNALDAGAGVSTPVVSSSVSNVTSSVTSDPSWITTTGAK